jgi:glutaredoxin
MEIKRFVMKIMLGKSWLVVFSRLCLIGALGPAIALESSQPSATLYFFWQTGCPHCAREKDFLQRLKAEQPALQVHELEISEVPRHYEVFRAVIERANIEKPGVPLTVIGENVIEGYNDDNTTGADIRMRLAECIGDPCRDWIAPILSGHSPSAVDPAIKTVTQPLKVLKLPVFGEIDVGQVSLPLLTLMLGAVDGFNPCAMWTLVFLISLLVGLRDRFRMWLLGGAFIVASATVYYLFMAAWLNLLLFLGMVFWIRIGIGVLALVGGGYYLHEYFVNPEGICKITAPDSRHRVLDRLRGLAAERNFLVALTGIVLLAFVVNAVELVCSAGLPAIYTQVLALSHLPTWQYHAYLALYILVFMLDDLLVFFVAMKTLKVTGLTGAYVRQAHFIGGAVMVLIGLMLLFRPEWLSFG